MRNAIKSEIKVKTVVLVKGIAQKFFLDMGLTMTFSLISSLVVAVMLVPSLLSRLKDKKEKSDIEKNPFIKAYEKFMALYLSSLRWMLRNRGMVLAVTTVLTLISLLIAFLIKAEQAPDIDQSRFTIEINMPYGSTLEVISNVAGMIEKELLSINEIQAVVSDLGISSQEDYFSILFASLNKGKIYVKIKPEYKVDDVMDKVRSYFERSGLIKTLSSLGAEVSFQRRSTTFERILQTTEDDIAIKIAGKGFASSSFDSLLFIAKDIVEKIKNIPKVTDLRTIPGPGNPQVRILVDKSAIEKYDLNSSDIVSEVAGYLRGKVATYISRFNEQIPIRIISDKSRDEDALFSLLNYSLKANNSKSSSLVPIQSVVKIEKGQGLNEIYHENGNRVALVVANSRGGNIFAINNQISDAIKDIELRYQNISIKIGGKIEEIYESYRGLLIIILLSIFIVYMILASEYESIVYPFVILLTSPLALVGAFIAMYLAGQSYNVMSIVGLVIMLGAIDNDAVIAVDLIILNRRDGMPLEDSIIDGMRKRFRPIVMTTLTTILGIIPLIVGFGKGLELAVAISYPIIGGLIASTIFTLFIIPVVYTYFDKFSLKGR